MGAGCTDYFGNSVEVSNEDFMTGSITETADTQEQSQGMNVEEKNDAEVMAKDDAPLENSLFFYIAEKDGTTTTVYEESLNTGEREEVFSFEEENTYDPTSGNTHDAAPASVDYSPEKNLFVYVDADGIHTYHVETSEQTDIVLRVADKDGIDGVIPEWDREPFLDDYSPALFNRPEFSDSGDRFSIVAGYYEGVNIFVYDFAQDTFEQFTSLQDGEYITRTESDWYGEQLVTASAGDGYGTPGLFVATEGQYSQAQDIIPWNELDEGGNQAEFIDADTIVYEDAQRYGADEAIVPLRTVDTAGNEITTLVDDSADNRLHLASEDFVFYEKIDTTNAAQNGLWMIQLDTGEELRIAEAEENTTLIPQHYSVEEDMLAVQVRNTETGEEYMRLYSVSDSGASQFATWGNDRNSTTHGFHFLGWR